MTKGVYHVRMIGRSTKGVSVTAMEKQELGRLSKLKRRTRSVAFRAQIVLHCAKGRDGY